jgi:hypothetical protein
MSTWQDIAALSCVTLAVMYIAWRVLRKLARRSGSSCGGCSSCEPAKPSDSPSQLVTLERPKEDR